MKKLLIVVVIWGLILGGGAAAYFYLFPSKPDDAKVTDGGDKDKDHKDHGKKLRLAQDGFSGYCIFRSDDFKKKLADQGIDFEYVDDGADYAARMKTIESGDTPLAVITIDALINNTPPPGEDPPATIIMAIDETRGADAMIGYLRGTPDVATLNRADQKIVLVPNSPSETLARVVRNQFKLPDLPVKRADYLIEAKDEDDAYSQFLQAKPFEHKAFVLWEPYVSKALQERPEARVLVDSSHFKGYIVDVLVAQRAWLHDHAAEAQAVVHTYLEILHARQQSTGGMTELVRSDAVDKLNEKLTPEEAAQIAKGIWWKNTMENYGHFGILPANQSHGLQLLSEMIGNITTVLDQTREPGSAHVGVARPDKLYDDAVLRPFFEQSKFQTDEPVREEGTVGALSDDQWAKLQRVGVFQAESIEFLKDGRHFSTFVDVPSRLANVAANMRQWPQYYLEVQGNVMGDDIALNRDLAQAQAEMVRDALIQDLGQNQAPRIRAVGMKPDHRSAVDFVMLQLPKGNP